MILRFLLPGSWLRGENCDSEDGPSPTSIPTVLGLLTFSVYRVGGVAVRRRNATARELEASISLLSLFLCVGLGQQEDFSDPLFSPLYKGLCRESKKTAQAVLL